MRNVGTVSFLVFLFYSLIPVAAAISRPDIDCMNIVSATDHISGLAVWNGFPTIGVSENSDTLAKESGLQPKAMTMWRFLNQICAACDVPIRPEPWLLVNVANSVNDLSFRPSLYVATRNDHLDDEVALQLLKTRFNMGLMAFTTKRFADLNLVPEREVIAIDIIRGITSPSISAGISIALFDAMTGLRIEEDSRLSGELIHELDDGCIAGKIKNCGLLAFGRYIYQERYDPLVNSMPRNKVVEYLCRRFNDKEKNP